MGVEYLNGLYLIMDVAIYCDLESLISKVRLDDLLRHPSVGRPK